MSTEEKHPCQLVVLDVRFKHDADMAALTQALDPPEDVLDNLSIRGRQMEDGLERRLEAWGWATDPYGDYRRTGKMTTLGVYGDFTLFEDDERFVKIIAPFVERGSRIVFVKGIKPMDDEYAQHDLNFPDEYQGWDFGHAEEGEGTVRLRRVEKTVEYEWA